MTSEKREIQKKCLSELEKIMVNEIKERSNNQVIFPLGFSAERSWVRIDYAQKESFPAGSSLFWRFFRFFKRTSMCCKFQIDFSAQSFTCFERTTCDLSLFPVPRFLKKLYAVFYNISTIASNLQASSSQV